MNEDLQQLLQNLKLKTIAARFDEMFAAAEQNGTPVPNVARRSRCERPDNQPEKGSQRLDHVLVDCLLQ